MHHSDLQSISHHWLLFMEVHAEQVGMKINIQFISVYSVMSHKMQQGVDGPFQAQTTATHEWNLTHSTHKERPHFLSDPRK